MLLEFIKKKLNNLEKYVTLQEIVNSRCLGKEDVNFKRWQHLITQKGLWGSIDTTFFEKKASYNLIADI